MDHVEVLSFWNDKALNFNKAVFPGTQGGPLEHVIASKAICFREALDPSFKVYARMSKKMQQH